MRSVYALLCNYWFHGENASNTVAMNEFAKEPDLQSGKKPVSAAYQQCVAEGEIEADRQQMALAAKLDHVAADLKNAFTAKKSAVAGLFSRQQSKVAKGLYIHGGVGRGKTMLMDLFYGVVEQIPRRRTHFHEFMADVHDRIALARKSAKKFSQHHDPIPAVATDIAKKVRLLCFDELHVRDIADAMILSRLFKTLFEHGIVVVATSNAHPDDLYKDGLNRALFLPFIALVHRHMDVVELTSAKDFRMDKLTGQTLYFAPADGRAKNELDRHWHRLTGRSESRPCVIEVKGRTIEVPQAAKGVARFSFNDLCAEPLGTIDYLHIAHVFHTILIDDIPVLTADNRNEARRFINLIDTLYDNNVSLIASAAAQPGELYQHGDGADHFQRTASRLMEMRTQTYFSRRQTRA